MRIEKPKPAVSSLVVILLTSLLVLILIPFFGIKKARSKPPLAPVQEVSTSLPESVQEEPLQANGEEAPQASIALTDRQPIEQVPAPAEPAPTLGAPAAFLTSFFGDVQILDASGKRIAKKNQEILEGETIEVNASSEAVLEIAELYVLRLKPMSQLTALPPDTHEVFSGNKKARYRFKLDRGAILGTTKYRGDKTGSLALTVQNKIFDIQDSTFRAEVNDTAPWIGVLRGNIKSAVEKSSQTPVVIHALEKVEISDQPLTAPLKVSKEEWGLLQETYEMNTKTAAEEARQIDLSKRAGDFFEYVFDHGTFYTENVGYTVRDFYEDKTSGDIYLEAEYDVFPSHSFVGLYVLTRDLNARDYGGLRFDIRRKPDEGYPDRFFIEIKSKSEIIQRFEITGIQPIWETRQIDFFLPHSTPITEVTLVFLNENIGPHAKGFIQMKNIQMVPLTPEQKTKRDDAGAKATTTSSAAAPESARSLKQSTVTVPLRRSQKVAVAKPSNQSPTTVDGSTKKIADEIPQVISLNDL